jgi:hypothetical protein
MRAALLLLVVAPAAAQSDQKPAATPDPRADLRILEAALARAADGVARPSPFVLAGHECRGYRIEGLGAVFVLPPRALRSSNAVVWRLPRRGAPHGAHDREIRIVERQAEELQREAARTHAEVERAMAEMQRELERRLQADVRAALAGASAAPPAPAPPAAPAPPLTPEAPMPPAPPWALWFEAGESEEAEAPTEVVVERMRDALAATLAEHGMALRGLRPEETIAAAVDFVPSFPFDGGRGEKTLVLRVKKRDLEESEAGRIGPDQLRARIEVVEY